MIEKQAIAAEGRSRKELSAEKAAKSRASVAKAKAQTANISAKAGQVNAAKAAETSDAAKKAVAAFQSARTISPDSRKTFKSDEAYERYLVDNNVKYKDADQDYFRRKAAERDPFGRNDIGSVQNYYRDMVEKYSDKSATEKMFADREQNARVNSEEVAEEIYGLADENGNTISLKDAREEQNRILNDRSSQARDVSEVTMLLQSGSITQEEADARMARITERYAGLGQRQANLGSMTLAYNDLDREYSDNIEKMASISKAMAEIEQRYEGNASQEGDDARYSSLNNQRIELQRRNQELETLIKDQEYVQNRNYYDFVKQNGTKEEVSEFESLMESKDDGFIERRIKAYKNTLRKIAVEPVAVIDAVRDFAMSSYGKMMKSNAKKQLDAGMISSKEYNEFLKASEEYISWDPNEDGFSAEERRRIERIAQETYYGEEGAARMIGQAIDSSGEFLTQALLFNNTPFGFLTKRGRGSLLAMASQSATDTYFNNLRLGYDEQTSMANAIGHGTLSYMTERIGMDSFMNTIAGGTIDLAFGNAVGYLADSMIKQGTSEGLEEVVEWFFSPIVDFATYGGVNADGTPITLEQLSSMYDLNDAGQSFAVAFLSAAMTGASGGIFATFNQYTAITDGKGMTTLNAIAKELDSRIRSGEFKGEELKAAQTELKKMNAALFNFKGSDPLIDAVSYEDNAKNVIGIEKAIIDMLTPDVRKMSETFRSLDSMRAEVSTITNAMLSQNNINVINSYEDTSGADAYLRMSPEARQNAAEGAKLLSSRGVPFVYDASLTISENMKAYGSDLIVTKDGRLARRDGNGKIVGVKMVNGYWDKSKGMMVLDPNTTTDATKAMFHEITHTTESTSTYAKLRSQAEKHYGSESALKDAADALKKRYSDYMKNEDATYWEKEAVAEAIGDIAQNTNNFTEHLAEYGDDFLHTVLANAKALFGNQSAQVELALNKALDERFKDRKIKAKDAKGGKQYSIGDDYILPEDKQVAIKQLMDAFDSAKDSNERISMLAKVARANQDSGFILKNRIKKLMNAAALGYDSLAEYNAFEKLMREGSIEELEMKAESVSKELAEGHNNDFGFYKTDMYKKLINEKNELQKKITEYRAQETAENIDRTPFEEAKPSTEMQLKLNKIDYVEYRTAKGGISVYAADSKGNMLDQGTFTREEVAERFGTKIANEIIENASKETKMINADGIPKNRNVLSEDSEYGKRLISEAKKSFGTTSNYEVVGYVMPDGKMLDFGDPEGLMRAEDHRNAPGGFETFAEVGNIRMFPETGGFELLSTNEPTEAQYRQLKKFLQNNKEATTNGSFIGISSDSDHIGRYDVASLVFDNGETPSQIISKVKSYFGQNSKQYSLSESEIEKVNDIRSELDSLGIPYEIDDDGYMTLYHRTTSEGKKAIMESGMMKANEDGLFFSTSENGSNNYGYGSEVVKLRIPANLLTIDDIFGDEASMRLPLGRNRSMDVSKYIDDGRNVQYSISSSLKEDLEHVFKAHDFKGSDIHIGTTSDLLVNKLKMPSRISGLDVYMDSRKAYSSMATKEKAIADGVFDEKYRYHELGVEGLKHALEASEDPICVFISRNTKEGNVSRNRLTIVTDQIDKHGNPIIVGMELGSSGTSENGRMPANKDITAFGKKGIQNLINRAIDDGTMLYFNNKKNQSTASGNRVQFPIGSTETDYNSNIAKFWDNFKSSEEISKEDGERRTRFDRDAFAYADEVWDGTKFTRDPGVQYRIGENDADMDIMSYIENFGRESLDALIAETDRNDAKANQEMQEHMEAQGKADLDALIDETDTRRAANDRMMKQRTEFLAEANRELNPNVEEDGTLGITDKDIESLLSRNGVSEKTFANIESIRNTMVENVDKWVPNADVIKAKYGGAFTKQTLDTAIYEAFAYGDVEPDTRSRMREDLIAQDVEGSLQGLDIDAEVDAVLERMVTDFLTDVLYKKNPYFYNKSGSMIVKAMDAWNHDPLTAEQINEIKNAVKGMEENGEFKSNLKDDFKDTAQFISENCNDLSKFGYFGTLEQNLLKMSGYDQKTYARLNADIVRPREKARAQMLALKSWAQDQLNAIRRTGITKNTKESQAVQWIMEGHTEKLRTDLKIDGDTTQETLDEYERNPWEKYDEEMLRRDFDYEMPNGKKAYENILDAAEVLRKAYAEMIDKVNSSQMDINGTEEAIKGELKVQLNDLKIKADNAMKNMKALRSQMADEGTTPELEAALKKVTRAYNSSIKKYNKLSEGLADNDAFRRQLTPVRKNYAPHYREQNLKNMLKGASKENGIPTELAGISSRSRPNTGFASFMIQQGKGEYNADAIKGFERYMDEASRLVAYNPVIVQYRALLKDLREQNLGTTRMSRFTAWLDEYTNTLAGKRTNFNRSTDEQLGVIMRPAKMLTRLGASAALKFNVRSALVQFGNIPNGLGILASQDKKWKSHVYKGVSLWAGDMKNDARLIDQSPFMASRFFDYDDGDRSFRQKMDNVADFMMTKGDQIAAEMIWYSAFVQSGDKILHNKEDYKLGMGPIEYADYVTRSAIAGRDHGDIPIAMQQDIIRFLLPFQIEVNNQWQTMARFANTKNAKALATIFIASFILNQLFRGIGLPDDPLSDPITPVFNELTGKDSVWELLSDASKGEEMGGLIGGETDIGTFMSNVILGEIGEAMSAMPGGSYIGQSLGDSFNEAIGDHSPSRYGSGTFGLTGIGDIFGYMADGNLYGLGEEIASNYLPGGTQAIRTAKGLQSMGALPKPVGKGDNFRWDMSPVNYTSSGKRISFVNDPKNVFDWMKAAAFGKWATGPAQEYIRSGFKSASPTASNVFQAMASVDGNASNADLFREAMSYGQASNESSDRLAESLKERDVFDEYIEQMNRAYEESDKSKTYYQFANTYGLTKKTLAENGYSYSEGKNVENQGIFEAYEWNDEQKDSYQKAIDIEPVLNEDGTRVRNSEQLATRRAMEDAGIYDDVIAYISENGIDPADYGLGKQVMSYDSEKFAEEYEKVFGK